PSLEAAAFAPAVAVALAGAPAPPLLGAVALVAVPALPVVLGAVDPDAVMTGVLLVDAPAGSLISPPPQAASTRTTDTTQWSDTFDIDAG
ncbi:MAG TPA: hypothetical protein VMF89_23680, partial [Polyangiales bacterium]|nr:hypothetical protein [Polyangiales bacterium]